MDIKQKVPFLFFLIFFLFAFALPMAASAEDPRIQEELDDKSPLMIPLKEALGAEEYDKAMKSGEYKYSGNLKCRLCHREFFMGRKKDIHEHTFRQNIQEKFGSEKRCLACHTTGYGVESGFISVIDTPKLSNVQCEGCHGPGSKHNTIDGKGGFLAGTDRPAILKKMCQSCHNGRWHKSFKDVDKAYKAYKEAEAKAGEY